MLPPRSTDPTAFTEAEAYPIWEAAAARAGGSITPFANTYSSYLAGAATIFGTYTPSGFGVDYADRGIKPESAGGGGVSGGNPALISITGSMAGAAPGSPMVRVSEPSAVATATAAPALFDRDMAKWIIIGVAVAVIASLFVKGSR